MELLVTTLSIDDRGIIRLDTVLGHGVLLASREPWVTPYLRAAAALSPTADAKEATGLPGCVQALIAAPALYEVLAQALWEQVVQVPVLDHARTALFS